jgi:hypothetical protein
VNDARLREVRHPAIIDRVRIELKLLLLGSTGEEPSFRAWQFALNREGVPSEAIVLGAGRLRRRSSRLRELLTAEAGHARFQAVILATGAVLEKALSQGEREALGELCREFGLRRLCAYITPSAEHGLTSPTWQGALHGVTARLSPGGLRVFPYLSGPVPIEAGTWAHLASPVRAESFETLVEGPDGSSLLGIHRRPDGREEMVQTYDSNEGQVQTQLLRHGQLAWMTHGRYLGHERNYLSLHIDDVFQDNHSWNLATHRADTDPETQIRMTADDAHYAASWSRARGLRLDFAYNGGGVERYLRFAGAEVDPLLVALLAEREAFRWINHTYGHANLDELSSAELEAQIAANVSWAEEQGLELDPGELVTGAHSGLANLAAIPPFGGNPRLEAALESCGIRYIASDASRPYPVDASDPEGARYSPGTPFEIGPAFAVPRHPTALPYDSASGAQALDRHRHTTAAGAHGSWQELMLSEATRMFATLTRNDPRPHYFHQSNLARTGEDGGIFYAFIDTVVGLYTSLFAPSAPLVQPTLGEVGELFARRDAWRTALESGSVDAHFDGSRVIIVCRTSAPLEVPVSGTAVGEEYGGLRSGWIRVDPGETVVET